MSVIQLTPQGQVPVSTDESIPADMTFGEGAYADTGCDYHPSCLSCPLPQCRYDDPAWFERLKQHERDLATLKQIEEHPESVKLCKRTIFRTRKRVREYNEREYGQAA